MSTTNKYNPHEHAHQLNIPIEYIGLPHNIHGLWTGDRILLDPKLTQRQERSVLAHEIVHAEHDHPHLMKSYAARIEARANRIAAQRLIDPTEYRQLAQAYEHPQKIAAELDVTLQILQAYQPI